MIPIFDSIVPGPITGCPSRNDGAKREHSRVIHSQRFENVLLNELKVGLSADPLKQISKHDIPEVAVGPSLTGLEVQRLIIKVQFVGRAGYIFRGVVGDAGSVSQQVINGNLVPRCLSVRQILRNEIIVFSFPRPSSNKILGQCYFAVVCHACEMEFLSLEQKQICRVAH